jgi:Kef-type K+ transport system membrane component KefB
VPGAGESLFWITLCAVLAPLLAGLAFRRRVPEVVLLLALGVVIGPNVLDLAAAGEGVTMLRELGLGMLFLLAGYELDPVELTGRGGRRALAAWLICLVLALGLIALLGALGPIHAEVAVAIALTSTALGTLLPILKDAGLLDSALGRTVMNHGAYGELGPVVAMSVLLGAHGPAESLIVLVVFAVVALLLHRFSARVGREGSKLLAVVRRGAETSGQTQVRLVVLLLVTLTGAAAAFDLDTVLEHKLEGLAFGLLIPVFFITSGMAIDPEAVVEEPFDLVAFVLLILLVRGGVVYLATVTGGGFDRRESTVVALFGSTGLPIIVAVTSVAVSEGQMTSTNASVLVAGGALTVLVCPLLAQRLLAPVTRIG